MNNGIGRIWAVNAEGGDEGRPNGVGPVYIENIDKLGSQLPDPEAGDAGKVLGVLNSDGDIGWVINQSGTFTQVQADWDQNDSSQVSYIANKPQNLVQDADYVHTDNNFTDAEKSKLGGIESGAQVNVKPDWNAAAGSAAEILNKPTIPTVDQTYNASSTNAQSGTAVASAVSNAVSGINQVPASTSIDSGKVLKVNAQGVAEWGADNDTTYTAGNGLSLNGTEFSIDTSVVATQSDLSDYQPVITDLETIRSGASAGATAVQPGDLSTVATTGSYTDLSNTPTIPTVDQVYDSASANAQSGVAVASAISGKQDTLTAGSNVSISNNVISATDTTYSAGTGMSLTGTTFSVDKPVPSTSSSDNGKVLGVTDTSGTLGWVNQTPGTTVDQTYSASSTNAQSGTAVAGALASYTPTASLATVATTGAYNDLSGKPTIPTVPDTKPVVAGSNVTITENANDITISATDTTYSAGTGLTLSGTTFNVSKPVPTTQSSDNGKVLGVTDTSGTLGWVSQPSPATIDQNYNASSTNAQSGTAVAQAIAAIPSASYTAGGGIDITSNEISVKAGTGLAINSSSTVSITLQAASEEGDSIYTMGILTAGAVAALKSGSVSITPKYTWGESGEVYYADAIVAIVAWDSSSYLAIGSTFATNTLLIPSTQPTHDGSLPANTAFTIDFTHATAESNLTLNTIEANPGNFCIVFGKPQYDEVRGISTSVSTTAGASVDAITVSTSVVGDQTVYVTNPVPTYSTSTDSGKVLSVGSNGIEWVTPSAGTTYTAGNMISLTNDEVAVSTTAGITDIQQVASLPANPVATVLYLIPEA